MSRLLSEEALRRLERLQLRVHQAGLRLPVGERPSRVTGRTADFSDHRPYTPGDDLRSVDWPAYARHDRLYVKVGPLRQGLAVALEVDTSPSMAWGQPPKLEAALRLAAALGTLSLAGGDRLVVRLVPGPGSRSHVWGPRAGKRQIPSLLAALEAARQALLGEPETPALSAARRLLGRADRVPPAGSALTGWSPQPAEPRAALRPAEDLLVLLSDLYAEEGLGAFLGARRRQETLVLHLLHGQELEPELEGEMELLPLEGTEPLRLGLDAGILAGYRRELRTWLDGLASQASGLRARYQLIRSDDRLQSQVLPYLWQRQHLVARRD